MPAIAAVILAAGRSSRMGRCKALLNVHGQSALRHIRENLYSAGIVEHAIVTGHDAEAIEAALPDGSYIYNADYAGGGMISSIKIGVENVRGRCDAMLVTLVDHPLVRPETIRQIVASGILHANKIVRPRYDEQMGHPVMIPAACADSILALPGQATLKSWMLEHFADVLIVDVNDPGILMDLDTPADYERAMEKMRCIVG